jgi:hypothetical protein
VCFVLFVLLISSPPPPSPVLECFLPFLSFSPYHQYRLHNNGFDYQFSSEELSSKRVTRGGTLFPMLMKGFHVGKLWLAALRGRCLVAAVLRRRRSLRAAGCVLDASYADARRSCSQHTAARSSMVDEDDVLVRVLIQDALHPSPLKEETEVPKQSDNIRHEKLPTANINPHGVETSASAVDANHVSAIAKSDTETEQADDLHDPRCLTLASIATPTASQLLESEPGAERVKRDCPVTDSRRMHHIAEVFAELRRRPSPHSGSLVTSPLGGVGDLEWMCLKCHSYNACIPEKKNCQSCFAPAEVSHRCCRSPVRHVTLMPAAWVCVYCAHMNETALPKAKPDGSATASHATFRLQRDKFMCGECGKPFTGVRAWTCPECNHLCPRAATQCPTCFSPRPVRWTCSACGQDGNSVFAVRCRQCDVELPTHVSNSITRCAFCNDWNDVRWELCATCMAPTSSMNRDGSESSRNVSGAENVLGGGTVTLCERWTRVADPLKPDTCGFLHSKTVENGGHRPTSSSSPDQVGSTKATVADAGSSVQALPRTSITPLVRKRTPMSLVDRAWWCSTCNVPQRRNASFCDICLQSRDHVQRIQREELEKLKAERLSYTHSSSASLEVGEELSVVPATADGDWRCPYCSTLHEVEVRCCCGHQREVPPGYWLCDRCGSTNRQEREACLGCGETQERARPWRCAVCAFQNESSAGGGVCERCGIPQLNPTAVAAAASGPVDTGATAAGTSIVCPVCAAPNSTERLSCYRCRARLHDFEWTCNECGQGHRDRQATRCSYCKAFRTFDLAEEVWVCEVCSTAVYSGGELPVRTQCPKCQVVRAATVLHFPARWRCLCGMYNRARMASCPECGTRRRLPTLDTVVSCPHCFRDTRLEVAETCEHCGESLGGCFEAYENLIWANGVTSSLLGVRDDDEDVDDADEGSAAAVLAGGAPQQDPQE